MKLFQADDVERRRRFTILTVGHIFRNPLLSGLLVIHGRMAFPVLFVFLGSGCASTSAAHRPLSDAAVAEVNELIEGRRAGVVLAEEPERAVERERAAQAAVQEACLSAA